MSELPGQILSPISQQIWDMKYRLKSASGAAIDRTVEDTWRRVALALAQPEKEPAAWAEKFYGALGDFRFLPAGRILAGAGTGRQVTLFNCFVMGDVPDDMAGIFENLKEAALTMQQGGGIGHDFSTLRPKGAPVKGVGADASGPRSFMDVWDAMCRTIMSAGSRRGAMMATMRCDHPDIEAFIDAKREPGRLRMFNLSVLASDAFMAAVEKGDPWPLVFGGTVFKTVSARELWDKIMRATYAYAEPGVIFIDRINRANNLHYCEHIHATNPCVTADTWVHTSEGPRQAGELVGRKVEVLVNGRPIATDGFFATGHKPVVKLCTREGYSLRLTRDHRVRRVAARTGYSIAHEWIPAAELRPGDLVVLHDHRAAPAWQGAYEFHHGYLIGLLVGDGVLKNDKAVLSVWPRARAANGETLVDGAVGIMQAALDAAHRMPHRVDFSGWLDVAGRGEKRLALGALRELALHLGLRPGDKSICPALERTSWEFHRGFLRGFFDTDGSVMGSQAKGVSVRLAQSDLPRLEAVQRMLLRLGIASTIYRNRRPAGTTVIPDGRGGRREYQIQAQHELVVSGENLARFAELVGFADTAKAARLSALLQSYRRRHNRERFVAEIESVDADGTADVFDIQVPGPNAFDANGLYVHNCGEQPLPAYGACLLGSVNLARLVREPFTENAYLDMEALAEIVPLAVRMMDNVVDVSRYPLPQQEHEARAKRRIGLGVTGLADALIMCRTRYGSAEAVRLTETWLQAVQRHSYLASAQLAAEKGAFPLFDREAYLAGETIRSLDEDVQAAIAEHGIRNALINSIAPTGTISLFADNVSSGIEPVFSFAFKRNILLPDGSRQQEEVSDSAWRLYRRLFGEEAKLPDYFVDAQLLSPADHVVMQAAAQKYIDSSISKTINVPEAISFEAFKNVYQQAYALGCKGCTTYRPNPITGAVLETGESQAEEQKVVPLDPLKTRPADELEAGVVYMTQPLDRPGELAGQTYKIKWPESDHAIYITLNDVVQDGRRRPFEIFINSKNMEHYAWTVALTRMISAVFRRGGDVSFVVEELKAVFDPRGGQWMGGRYVPSLLAAIGEVIERHMVSIGFIAGPDRREADSESQARRIAAGAERHPARGDDLRLRQCPKCGSASLTRREGCDVCMSCGYSKCS